MTGYFVSTNGMRNKSVGRALRWAIANIAETEQ